MTAWMGESTSMTGTGLVGESLNRFLDRETFMLTVNGAIGRNPTYRKDAIEKGKREFRESLEAWLGARIGEYREGPVDDVRHVDNIEDLSSELSARHGKVLLNGQLRIGTAQKALNLYLKYGWARGIIHEPPHCPIDSFVLAEIEKCPKDVRCETCYGTTWTKIVTRHEYLHFVDKAREAAEARGLSLSRWELEVWEAATSRA